MREKKEPHLSLCPSKLVELLNTSLTAFATIPSCLAGGSSSEISVMNAPGCFVSSNTRWRTDQEKDRESERERIKGSAHIHTNARTVNVEREASRVCASCHRHLLLPLSRARSIMRVRLCIEHISTGYSLIRSVFPLASTSWHTITARCCIVFWQLLLVQTSQPQPGCINSPIVCA